MHMQETRVNTGRNRFRAQWRAWWWDERLGTLTRPDVGAVFSSMPSLDGVRVANISGPRTSCSMTAY